MKKVSSSLNLDLNLSLVHSLWTIETLLCQNGFQYPVNNTSTRYRTLDKMGTVTSLRRVI